MDNEKELRKKYKVYCIMHNLIEHERGFKSYKQDQKMLERFRKKQQ